MSACSCYLGMVPSFFLSFLMIRLSVLSKTGMTPSIETWDLQIMLKSEADILPRPPDAFVTHPCLFSPLVWEVLCWDSHCAWWKCERTFLSSCSNEDIFNILSGWVIYAIMWNAARPWQFSGVWYFACVQWFSHQWNVFPMVGCHELRSKDPCSSSEKPELSIDSFF